MEVIIALLKEAVKQYEQSHSNVGDEALQQAIRLRRETKKAEKLSDIKSRQTEPAKA